MQSSLKKKTLFYGVAKYTNTIVTLLTTSILSRILTPEEYGVVAVVTVFITFFTILSDMGLGTAVVQNKELTTEEVDDIFSFSSYMALGLGVIFLILGVPIAWFYENPVYVKICALLSISVFFNAMNIIPNAALMKTKEFHAVGIRLIVTAVASGVVAVVLALLGFSFYTLIIQSIFQSAFMFFWNWSKTKLKFRFRFRMQSINKVRQYSFYQFLFSVVNYFARNLDNLLIGKTLGDVALAYYDKGYKLTRYPVQNLPYMITPVLHPILSEYQHDKEYIFNFYVKLSRVMSILGVVISSVFVCCGEELIMLFFGDQWGASVPIFRWLSISIWPQLVCVSAGTIYQSLGDTKLMFKSGMIHFGVSIAAIILGILTDNLTYIALFVAISLYLRFLIDFYFLIVHAFKFRYTRFLKEFRWDLLDAIIMAAAVFGLSFVNIESYFLSLLVKAGALCLLYLGLVIVNGQYKIVWSFLKSKKKKKA